MKYYNFVIIDEITLKAPIEIGEVVGSMNIINNSTGEIIESLDLIAKNSIAKSTFTDYLRKIFKIFIMSGQVEVS